MRAAPNNVFRLNKSGNDVKQKKKFEVKNKSGSKPSWINYEKRWQWIVQGHAEMEMKAEKFCNLRRSYGESLKVMTRIY